MGQRFEGKSLEEALQNASAELGAERYQLRYHVVVEKRGFLGGLKRIVIEASVDDTAAAPPPAPPRMPPPERLAPSGNREPRGPRRGSPRAEGGRERGRRGGGRSDRGRDDRGGRAMRGPRRPELPEDVPEQGEQSENARRIAEWCAELFDLGMLEMTVRTEESEEAIHVRLYGRDAQRFIDRDGELLDSIQVICNKALGHELEKAIEFDCGSFKRDRMEALGRQALEAADRVRSEGREQLLPAMSPIERRIVHIALREAGDVATESRGEGFFKRVAIIPKEERPAEP